MTPLSHGFDASIYPRSYEVSLGWKLLLVFLGLLIGLGAIAGLGFLVLFTPLSQRPSAALFLGAICAGLAALGTYTVFSAVMYRVVLSIDGVEVLEPLRRRRMLWSEIQGRRTLRTKQGLATVVLVPKDGAGKELTISSFALKKDQAFEDWLARLSDLDRGDIERSESQIAEARYQHLVPEERAARINRLKRLAIGLNMGTVAFCFSSLFLLPDYRPLVTAALMILPWVAVWLVGRYQPLYRFGAKRNDAHPDLTIALMAPGLMLSLRVLPNVHTVDWTGPALLAAAGVLTLGGAALRVDPWFRQQRVSAILTCLFISAYGYGAGLTIDVVADSTGLTMYSPQVLGKRVSRGSKSSSYYLQVSRWGPFTSGDEISVSASRYRATHTGETICVYAGKGAFNIAWYQVRDCPDGSHRHAP